MDFLKEHNYVLVGPGASGKSHIYNSYPNRTKKFSDIKPDSDFFTTPSGRLSYLSPNADIYKFIEKVKNCPILVVVCRCNMKILRRRLTDRLFRRIRKYENNDYYRLHMAIFARNYMYDYNQLFRTLNAHGITYCIEDTAG